MNPLRNASGTSAGNTWRRLLEAMIEAEKAGQADSAARLRRELVRERARLRVELQNLPVTGLDLALLEHLAADLRRCGLDEEALAIYDAAREHARSAKDRFKVGYYEVLAAQSCISLLDFATARHLLQSNLPPNGTLEPAAVRELAAAIRGWDAADADPDTLRGLRMQLLIATARYQAAIGQLGCADVLVSEAIAAGRALGRTELVEQLAIFQGEIRLDRGDVDGLQQLLDAVRPRRSLPLVGGQWQILEGAARVLQGRFSDAVLAFEQAVGTLAPVAPGLAGAAAWQRIHALAMLNRLDEAEYQLGELAVQGLVEPDDLRLLGRLVQARREASPAAYQIPPTPKEFATRPGWPSDAEELAPRQPNPPGQQPSLTISRTRERIRDDWASWANRIQLDLHEGRLGEALVNAAGLLNWTSLIDSALLTARGEYLQALLSFGAGDDQAALRHADWAQQQFAQLRLPADEWNACQVACWVLSRLKTGPALVQTYARARSLLERVGQMQRPADQVLYRLNKWRLVDDWLAELCRQLHTGGGASAGRRQGRARQRNVCRTLELIEDVSRWGEACLTELQAQEVSGAGRDVFSLALQQLHNRRGRQRSGAGGSRIRPGWLMRDTAVVRYLAFPDHLVAIVLQRHAAEPVAIRRSSSRVDLHGLVRGAVNLLRAPRAWNPDSRQLCELRDAVGLDEIVNQLSPRVKRLLIIPDNILHHVPFSALPVGGRPLIERIAWAFLPEWTWVSRPARVRRSGARFLRVAVGHSTVAELEELPNAETEVDALEEFAAPGATLLKHSQATRAAVLAYLPGAELCHFACHGEFSPESPLSSGLALQDAWLTVRDLRQTSLEHLELAVIGACWGGNVVVLPGNESIGLPVVFLERGARAVVSCLWGIADAASVDFTKSLYRHLTLGGVSEALANAQAEFCGCPTNVWAGYASYLRGISPVWYARWWRRLVQCWLR